MKMAVLTGAKLACLPMASQEILWCLAPTSQFSPRVSAIACPKRAEPQLGRLRLSVSVLSVGVVPVSAHIPSSCFLLSSLETGSCRVAEVHLELAL